MTIAIWCILIAGMLPYVAFGFVKGLVSALVPLTLANSITH